MTIRLCNPPQVILARSNSKEADIGGARSIIAMDKDYNFYVVENIFSELSKAKFWDEPGLEDEIEDITPVFMDNSAIYDEQVLIERITNAFQKMRKNHMIFYGIAGFESNAFVTTQFVDLSDNQRELLQEAHRRMRNQRHFPRLSTNVTNQSYISCMFHGVGYTRFHLPKQRDFYSIAEQLGESKGFTAGIILTAEGAANFYIITQNLHSNSQNPTTRTDFNALNEALKFINNDVVFPVAWFRFYLGSESLPETVENWNEIKDDPKLKLALDAYRDFITTRSNEYMQGKTSK